MSINTQKLPIFLDCKVTATPTYAAGTSTFVFSGKRPYTHMVALASGTLFALSTADNLTFVAGTGYDPGACVVGRAYDCDVLLSDPVVRDPGGAAIVDGSITVHRLIVKHKDAIRYTVEVVPDGRSSTTTSWADDDGAGTFGLHKHGINQIFIMADAKNLYLYLHNSTPYPATWTGYELDCVYQNVVR